MVLGCPAIAGRASLAATRLQNIARRKVELTANWLTTVCCQLRKQQGWKFIRRGHGAVIIGTSSGKMLLRCLLKRRID